MKHVTRDIDLINAQDLLERVPRACLSYVGERGIRVEPVGVNWQAGRFLVCMPANDGLLPKPDQEAVLLVDEGIHYFELRAVYIRGQLHPVENEPRVRAAVAWYELNPVKITAWDYGTLHEVDDGD